MERVERAAEVRALLNRSFPGCVILEGDAEVDVVIELCGALKGDVFTGIVPVVVLLPGARMAAAARWWS